MLQTGAHVKELRAVVSEGAGFRSYRETFESPGRGKWLTLPAIATLNVGMAVFSNSMPPEKLHDLVGQISPRPVFLIYAEQGQGGENMNRQYYERAGEPKELWEVPDAKHVGGLDAHPEEYERRVTEFFDRALRPEG